MAERFANNSQTSLNGAINASQTTFTVIDASKLPSQPQFRIRVDDELMLVTGVSGNTLTVTRGVESTTAVSHNNQRVVRHVLTAGAIDAMAQKNSIVASKVWRQASDGSAPIGSDLPISATDRGAVANGSTDDTAALQAAITSGDCDLLDNKTYAHSGTIVLPCGPVSMGPPVVGHQRVGIRGRGWSVMGPDVRGSAYWSYAGNVQGTVLKQTGAGAQTSIRPRNDSASVTQVGDWHDDYFVLGNGDPGSVGLDYAANQGVGVSPKGHRVGFGNLGIGMRYGGALLGEYNQYSAYGCDIGFDEYGGIVGPISSMFTGGLVQQCGIGQRLYGSNKTSIRDRSYQGCTTSILIKPTQPVSNPDPTLIDGCFFEPSYTNGNDITIDTTLGNVFVTVTNCRASRWFYIYGNGGGKLYLIGANSATGSWTLTLPPSFSTYIDTARNYHWIIDYGTYTKIVDERGRTGPNCYCDAGIGVTQVGGAITGWLPQFHGDIIPKAVTISETAPGYSATGWTGGKPCMTMLNQYQGVIVSDVASLGGVNATFTLLLQMNITKIGAGSTTTLIHTPGTVGSIDVNLYASDASHFQLAAYRTGSTQKSILSPALAYDTDVTIGLVFYFDGTAYVAQWIDHTGVVTASTDLALADVFALTNFFLMPYNANPGFSAKVRRWCLQQDGVQASYITLPWGAARAAQILKFWNCIG